MNSLYHHDLVSRQDYCVNPFVAMGDDWMLITAGSEEDIKEGAAKKSVNTMTASWGGFGHMWNKDVVYMVIRQSRYTKEFVDAKNGFSLSFLNPNLYRKEMGYLGRASGREEDKIASANLQVAYHEGVPYIEQADTVMICRKMYRQSMNAESMLLPTIQEQYYPDGDFHDLYIGEVVAILKQNVNR